MNELTKKDETPSYLTTTSGRTGFEEVGAADKKTAFMKFAQLNTDEAQPGPDAIDGLKPGEFFNSSTRTIYGATPTVVIVAYKRSFNEWEGEGKNGKLVGQYTPSEFEGIRASCTSGPDGKLMYNGHRIVDSRNFLLVNADKPEEGVFQYTPSITGITAARSWLSMASSFRDPATKKILPIYSREWLLSGTWTTGPKGNFYKLNNPQDMGWVRPAIFEMVKAAFDMGGAAIAEAKPEDESVPF